MNEGYALFDKVVSVLENANMFQSVRDTVASVPGTQFKICSLALEPGAYLIIGTVRQSVSEETGQLAEITIASGQGTLYGQRANTIALNGGGANAINVIEATTNVTVDLDTYGYGSTAKNYTGTIIAVKLLRGGVLRNLVARPRKAVVA